MVLGVVIPLRKCRSSEHLSDCHVVLGGQLGRPASHGPIHSGYHLQHLLPHMELGLMELEAAPEYGANVNGFGVCGVWCTRGFLVCERRDERVGWFEGDGMAFHTDRAR